MSVKSSLMEYVKHNAFVYKIFNGVGKFSLGLMKCFVKPDEYLILFNSFGGKKYDDSPRAIYELMKADERFKKYRLMWAFHNPDRFPEDLEKIKTDTLRYFITALKARCWVSNSSMQRGIEFKGKRTYSFNTWHGTPLKKMGRDFDAEANCRIMQSNNTILAQSRYELEKMSHAYHVPDQKYQIFGLPRNDILARAGEKEKQLARERIGIPKDKKVVLYAPTFRDYQLSKAYRCEMDIPLDYDYWENLLGDEYIFLMRLHYEVANRVELPKTSMWRDCSAYPVLNDLMLASDILISDYSSIIFDYAILNRPIFCFTYDYDEYEAKRGMYFDVRKELSSSPDSHELAQMIQKMDWEQEVRRCEKFRARYVEECGHAAEKSLDYIFERLRED